VPINNPQLGKLLKIHCLRLLKIKIFDYLSKCHVESIIKLMRVLCVVFLYNKKEKEQEMEEGPGEGVVCHFIT
jgi:hypothetical protein